MASIDRSRLNALYEWLLTDADGQPRQTAQRALISNGEPRKLIKRLFFKKNGTTRPYLTAPVRAFFEGPALRRWIEIYDTPPDDWLRELSASREQVAPVLVVLPLESDLTEARRRVHSIIDSVGVRVSVLPIGAEGPTRSEVVRLLAQADIEVLTPDNKALPGFARMVHVGAGAVLRPYAIRHLSDTLAATEDAIAAYSDTVTCKEDQSARSWFKPVFSPVLSRSKSLFDAVFAVDLEATLGLNPAQTDWRAFEQSLSVNQVIHLPQICYELMEEAHPDREGQRAAPQFLPASGEAHPKIAIIIPTRNYWTLLGPCLASIERSDWPADRLEVIVVDNGSEDAETLSNLAASAEAGKISMLRDNSGFNFSRLNNLAVETTDADILVFLNNDTEVRDSAWLRKLAYYAVQPAVGAVGAKLLYEDGTVQHAGVVVGIHGGAGHSFVGIDPSDGGYNELALVDREVSAVTGACLAVRRPAFLEAGGFDEALRVAFNDIALCSSLREKGLENILIADALITHHESKSRGGDVTASKRLLNKRETIYARSRFDELWRADPYYSPNLSLESPYQIAFPPRRRAIWKTRDAERAHVLVLSSVHRRGAGIPLVIERHVRALLDTGFRVTVGGPAHPTDQLYGGAERVALDTPRAAAQWAQRNDVDIIWAHTTPYYSCARWIAGRIPIHAFDHSEPPPHVFADWQAREDVRMEKAIAMVMCDRVFAISEAIRDKSALAIDGVIPGGNDHFPKWSEKMQERRQAVRAKHNWKNAKIVLNVCESMSGERHYEGIQTYLELMRQYKLDTEQLEDQVRFVLCGAGRPEEVAILNAAGLEVFAEPSDEELVDMFAAADVYADFSSREGYDPGMGRALASGLQVLASDTVAHRALGVRIFTDVTGASRALEEIFEMGTARQVRLWPWSASEQIVVTETRRGCGLPA